ncbi:MAG: isoprenylcysteine carboxylmethyltransferase family protein [Deltaproteobacteria bacterium]|nr:isoprenylcysteine carboxylmethyltransferase family protein [Deltaproteobacteria bacterium]
MTRSLIFIIGTLFFLRFSWRSLGNPASHGFYRFFVFEGLLGLILRNHPHWFKNPFAPVQLFSWLLLLASIFFVIHSRQLLKKHGGQSERMTMPENHAFENTVELVEKGIYRHIRHPMYASLLFLGWGAFFKNINRLNLGLIFVVSVALLATARSEEHENLLFFGSAYRDYMRRTRRFIPWLL